MMSFSRSAKPFAAIMLVSALALAIGASIEQVAATPISQSLQVTQGNLKPVQIPVRELPQSLRSDVVFRTLASGGFAGQTYETLLFKNGLMVRNRVNRNGTQSEIATRHLDLKQVQQFEKWVQTRMKPFDRLSYPARSGSADFITVTATSHAATVQYADSTQSQLPLSLKNILQAWNRLISNP